MRTIYTVQDAERSSGIASSVIGDSAKIASGIRKKKMIMVSVRNAERNFTEIQTTNIDVTCARKKPIKPQHVRGREDTENGKITVQIKKVN